MNTAAPEKIERERKDRTDDGMREVQRWKDAGFKGEVVFCLDGSGIVARIKIERFI